MCNHPSWVLIQSVSKWVPFRLLYCYFIHHKGCSLLTSAEGEGWGTMICLVMEACKRRLLGQGPLSCQPLQNPAAAVHNNCNNSFSPFSCVRVWTAELIVVWVTPHLGKEDLKAYALCLSILFGVNYGKNCGWGHSSMSKINQKEKSLV